VYVDTVGKEEGTHQHIPQQVIVCPFGESAQCCVTMLDLVRNTHAARSDQSSTKICDAVLSLARPSFHYFRKYLITQEPASHPHVSAVRLLVRCLAGEECPVLLQLIRAEMKIPGFKGVVFFPTARMTQ